jgi:hypothetical protein
VPTYVRYPEVEVELTDTEVDALRTELDALASTPKFAESAPEVRDRFQPGVIVDREQLSSQQLLTLLRALDHMRNASQLAEGGERVREAMAAAGIRYKLEINGAVQPADFISYGGMYDARDRLVAASGEIFRVIETREVRDPTVLVVAPA